MRVLLLVLAVVAPQLTDELQRIPDSGTHSSQPGYLGFDRNEYPGDANLKPLSKTFSYAGYWLNNPPGANANSWTGTRRTIQDAGFGFLVIFNGRTYAEIKAHGDAIKLGSSDAATAALSARAEGFPPNTIIFLDQEQGGRLLPPQRSYLHAWIDGVNSANFVAGVYCSGIAAKEGAGTSVITANDIHENAVGRLIKYWVVNDSCPPSPGCSVSRRDLSPDSSGISFADVWQFSQSPQRSDVAGACPANYNKDRNCYPPPTQGLTQYLRLDLDVATSSDPSHGRQHD